MSKASKTDPSGNLGRLGATMNELQRKITLLGMQRATDLRKIEGLRGLVQKLETRLLRDNFGELPALPSPGDYLPSTLLPPAEPKGEPWVNTLREEADEAIDQVLVNAREIMEGHHDEAGWGSARARSTFPVEVFFWRRRSPAHIGFLACDDGTIRMEGKGVKGEPLSATYSPADISGEDYLTSVVEAILDLNLESDG